MFSVVRISASSHPACLSFYRPVLGHVLVLWLCRPASLQTLGINAILPADEQPLSCLFILTHPFSLLQYMEADLCRAPGSRPSAPCRWCASWQFLPAHSVTSSEPSAPTACWQARFLVLHSSPGQSPFSCFHPSSESCPVEILYFLFPINCVSPLFLSWLLFAISQICFLRMEFSFVPQNVLYPDLCLTGGIPCCPGWQFV